MDESKDIVVGTTSQHSAIDTTSPAINIGKLAEKVYQLMRAEIRLAQARGNKRSTRK